MCGLVAAVWREQSQGGNSLVEAACDAMAKRGPDAQGLWNSWQVSLGHRRLSILDPQPRANQPMTSPDGRYRIVYNGEIYNFRQLRQELGPASAELLTDSDTEVLLTLFERYGVEMLSRLRGMFALAIWDERDGRLLIARDPYGIKPLYVARTHKGILVASQVKALLATGLVSTEPDPWGQATFWLTGSLSEPHTWFRQVQAFPPGHYAWVDRSGMSEPKCWQDVTEAFRGASDQEASGDPQLPISRAVSDSIEAHQVSDVPVGVFLSGGIDSGVIGSLLSARSAGPLVGVTLKFEEFSGSSRDESALAAQVAREYGIRHHVRLVTSAEFDSDRDHILADMDQPSVDGVNTWYASKAIKELGLKVALSGVGGDELFQGYQHFGSLPRAVAASALLHRIPGWDSLSLLALRAQARRSGNPRWLDVPSYLRSLPGAWLMRRGLFSVTELPSVMGTDLAHEALTNQGPLDWVEAECGDLPANGRLALSLIESRLYLRNQLLRDSDWASMAHGVELRIPLVDSRLLAAVMPYAVRLQHYPNKALLAGAASSPLPPGVTGRRKTGFGIPVQQWIGSSASGVGRHPTRAWAMAVANSANAM